MPTPNPADWLLTEKERWLREYLKQADERLEMDKAEQAAAAPFNVWEKKEEGKMAVKVVTVSTCDRCGRVSEYVGPDGVMPEFWTKLTLLTRIDNTGRANPTEEIYLCDGCKRALRLFMNPPKDAPKGPGNTVEATPGSGDALIQGTI